VGHRERLYFDSASFHAKIEMVANALPIIVEALAVSAEEEDQRIRAMLKVSMDTLGPSMWFPSST